MCKKVSTRIVTLARSLTALVIMGCFYAPVIYATTYPLSDSAIVGQWQIITIEKSDTISQLATRYNLSMRAIMKANPQITPEHKIYASQKIRLPTCHQLPDAPRQGIVVNIANQTLYYYSLPTNEVFVFPITVGMPKHPTAVGQFKIVKKAIDPFWYPTKTIIADYLKRGITLSPKIPPGKNNPLGKYVLYLNTPQQWIHTAINIAALGGEQSYGCMRMYESDIEKLYALVEIGTPVTIVKQPVDSVLMEKHCAPIDSQTPLIEDLRK